METFRTRNPRRHQRIGDYERLLASRAHVTVAEAVLAEGYRPAPPFEGWLNKADGRKKRIFQYPPVDELLFRVLNRLLQPLAAEAASPACRSFLPGGGARAAFRNVLSAGAVDDGAALRLDVRDYFNSIDPARLLTSLPASFTSGPVGTLLSNTLLDRRVVDRHGAVVDGGRKGVMAGTPLAPLLATLHLAALDREVAAIPGVTYVRYSDDIIAVSPPRQVAAVEGLIRQRLHDLGLEVNEAKSSVAPPGDPWDFLGFRYHRGVIGLAPVTTRKFHKRATRLARGLLRWRERTGAPPDKALEVFVKRTNRRLFGVREERAEFSWATWFLPMLDGPSGLEALDEHLRREARYAATGRRNGRSHQLVPHEKLVQAGHLPLVAAYWAVGEGRSAYDALVARRTGLGAVAAR